jgi:protein-tyrosine phosphatase
MPTPLPIRTSETDPIRVDWLPERLPGRVGLTFAPGKKTVTAAGFRWERDLRRDLDDLAVRYRSAALVCLLEDDELGRLGISALVPEALHRGIEVRRFPVPDYGVPASVGPVRHLVGWIEERAISGKNVVIHCAGGLGRTGTIAGCFLVERGMGADEALLLLPKVRGSVNCPETDAQRLFVHRYAIARGATPFR